MGTGSGGWGDSGWGDPTWGGPPPEQQDPTFPVSDLLNKLYPRLHASGPADLWPWTEQDLVDYMNDGLKKLATTAGGFVKRTTRSSVAMTSVYELPADHISTIHVSYDGRSIAPRTTREIEALDYAWQANLDQPQAWYQDTLSEREFGVYPIPPQDKDLVLVHHYWVEAIIGGPVAIPEIVGDYIEEFALQQAYSHQHDAALPDTAAFLAQKLAWWESIFAGFYGVPR